MLPDRLPDGDLFTGRSHPGMISYAFLESHGVTISAVKPLPLQLMAGARLIPDGGVPERDWWGERHAALLRRVRTRLMILYAIGMTPPAATITVDSDGRPQIRSRVDAALSTYVQSVVRSGSTSSATVVGSCPSACRGAVSTTSSTPPA